VLPEISESAGGGFKSGPLSCEAFRLPGQVALLYLVSSALILRGAPRSMEVSTCTGHNLALRVLLMAVCGDLISKMLLGVIRVACNRCYLVA